MVAALTSCSRLREGTFALPEGPFARPSHAGFPSQCGLCHESKRPQNTVFNFPPVSAEGHFAPRDCHECHQPGARFEFKHVNYAGERVVVCQGCHEPARKTPDHHAGVDCAGCHQSGAASWKDSVLSPHPANNPSPATCVDCHEKDRPVPGGYFGSTVPHGKAQDCVLCHYPKSGTITQFKNNYTEHCLACHDY